MSGIPVFLTSDNNYAPFVATTMASICANTKSFIEFYVLDDGISDKNKQKIRKTSKFFNNFSIEFIQTNTGSLFAKLPSLPYISKATYSRFIIPSIKPELKKVIFSDVDVAFMDDIKELYDIDLGSHPIGAIPLYRITKSEIDDTKRLGLNLEDLFMAGLLVIDVNKWNNANATEKLIEIAEKLASENKLRMLDQDILNKFFNGDFFRVDKIWCVIHKNLKSSNLTQEEIADMVKNQKIAHFAGNHSQKPWNNKNIEGAEYFWKYVPYTAFRKDIERINREFNKPVKPVRPKHYRRKYINMLLKLIVSKRKYQKLKKNPALFFSDSKNSFIKFLGRLYL